MLNFNVKYTCSDVVSFRDMKERKVLNRKGKEEIHSGSIVFVESHYR